MHNDIDLFLNGNTSENIAVDIGCSNNSYTFWILDCKRICIDYDKAKTDSLPRENNTIILNERITPSNVNDILTSNGVPKQFKFLNLDIDGYDIFVLDSLLSYFSPYLICSEINEKIPPPIKFSVLFDENYRWAVDHFFGYSISYLEDILDKYGYDLVKLEYNNVFLIKTELNKFEKMSINDAYNNGYILRPDRSRIFYYNQDVQFLIDNHPVDKKIEFIDRYFKKYDGKYVAVESNNPLY